VAEAPLSVKGFPSRSVSPAGPDAYIGIDMIGPPSAGLSAPPPLPLDYAAHLIDDRFLELNSKTVAEVRLERDRLAYLIVGHRPAIARDMSIPKPSALRL
jgi:hypothetical protein